MYSMQRHYFPDRFIDRPIIDLGVRQPPFPKVALQPRVQLPGGCVSRRTYTHPGQFPTERKVLFVDLVYDRGLGNRRIDTDKVGN